MIKRYSAFSFKAFFWAVLSGLVSAILTISAVNRDATDGTFFVTLIIAVLFFLNAIIMLLTSLPNLNYLEISNTGAKIKLTTLSCAFLWSDIENIKILEANYTSKLKKEFIKISFRNEVKTKTLLGQKNLWDFLFPVGFGLSAEEMQDILNSHVKNA